MERQGHDIESGSSPDTPASIQNAKSAQDVDDLEIALDQALKSGSAAQVRELLSNDLLRARAPTSDWMLKTDDWKILGMLLQAGARVDAQDQKGRTPLFLAVKRSASDVIELLVAYGADPHAQTRTTSSPMARAVSQCEHAIVDLFLSAGHQSEQARQFSTNLVIASDRQDFAMAERLLQHGSDPNMPSARDGRYPIDLFSRLSRLLRRYGMTPSRPGMTVQDVLAAALERKEDFVAQWILSGGEKYSAAQIHQYCQLRQKYTARSLDERLTPSVLMDSILQARTWIKRPNHQKQSLQFLASSALFRQATRLRADDPALQTILTSLIRQTIATDTPSLLSYTIASLLVKRSRAETLSTWLCKIDDQYDRIARKLAVSVARIVDPDFEGSLKANSGELIAALQNHDLHGPIAKACEVLHLFAKKPESVTSLIQMIIKGEPKVVRFLLDLGASPHLPDADGLSPLHHAASRGMTDTIDALIECGARIDAPDVNGLTPIIYARHKGHEALARSLEARLLPAVDHG